MTELSRYESVRIYDALIEAMIFVDETFVMIFVVVLLTRKGRRPLVERAYFMVSDETDKILEVHHLDWDRQLFLVKKHLAL